jgi:hypothetical protein
MESCRDQQETREYSLRLYTVAAEEGRLELVLVAPLVLPFDALLFIHGVASVVQSRTSGKPVSDGRVGWRFCCCWEAHDEVCDGLTWSLVWEWPTGSQEDQKIRW